MFQKLSVVGIVALLCFGEANADCITVYSDTCVSFKDLFGIEETECKSQPCEAGWDGFECPSGMTEYKYEGNSLDYVEYNSPLPGSTSIDVQTGDLCIRKRACNKCVGIFPAVPDCSSDLDWENYIWGSTVVYNGEPCN